MNIRIVGPADQVRRFAKIIPGNHKIYSGRNYGENRLYLNIDDRKIEKILLALENNQFVNLDGELAPSQP